MGAAFAWGLVSASSLLIGAVIAFRLRVGTRTLGLIMAFGVGVLISAVAYELVLDAFHTSEGMGGLSLGLLAGAGVFFAGDLLIDRMGGEGRKDSRGGQEGGSALAIVLGIVLDGIPESIVLGLTLLLGGGVSVSFLVAVFLANLPESIAATTGLQASGWPSPKIIALWSGVVLVSGLSALAGYALFKTAAPHTVAFVQAFAGGAILTMLADTMMPEAYERGGRLAGIATTIGFGVAFALTTLD